MKKEIKCYVYVLHQSDSIFYKIGHSINVEHRLNQINTSSPTTIVFIKKFKFDDKFTARQFEKYIHRLYYECRSPRKEWFALTLKQIDDITIEYKAYRSSTNFKNNNEKLIAAMNYANKMFN